MTMLGKHGPLRTIQLTREEFELLRRLVFEQSGIHLSDHKQDLLRGRLQKRLWDLQIETFKEYYTLLKHHDADGSELVQLLNCISTNKTEFYREADHFDFLADTVVPQFRSSRPFRVLSAGCSSGEEPYTLAMVLADAFQTTDTGRFQIQACDINTEVLDHARQGIYSRKQVELVPPETLRTYFDNGFGRFSGHVQAKAEIRRLIEFQRMNLMERLPYQVRFQAIFCRNVAIYFDRETQLRLFKRFCNMLVPGGFLFLGHSESLISYSLPLKYRAPSTYQLEKGYVDAVPA